MKQRYLIALLLAFVATFAAKAQIFNDSTFRVSIITCYPGQQVYALYGHTAIRIQNGDRDMAYNFGMFSFNKPNFIYRFVKGETDYALGSYPFVYFMPEYIQRNSKVVEQVLNIDNNQARALYEKLEYLALPENREYRYNYVLDNCATRPRDLVEEAVGGINYPVPADTTLTFRDIMCQYSPNYPWYQFGIDLALGSGIDYRLDARKQMFAPIYLMTAFEGATYTDANGNTVPLVAATNVLYNGSESPVLPPTPWYMTPLFLSWLLLAIFLLVSIHDQRRKKVTRWIDFIWFTITGLPGCLLFFLIFVSVHEATSPNYLGYWLNPLCFIASITIWINSCRKWLYSYHFINFAVVLVLLATWWLNPQTANAAFFPLMLCTILRSANYLIIYKRCEKRNK